MIESIMVIARIICLSVLPKCFCCLHPPPAATDLLIPRYSRKKGVVSDHATTAIPFPTQWQAGCWVGWYFLPD